MCGIAGFASASPDADDVNRLRRALGVLQHRGPDDEGWLTHPTTPDRGPLVGLGNRRLRIIDLSPGGHQPMTTADGRYSITYNGEIYNYRELRSDLETAGHRFVSSSDTEVLLHAWAAWGTDALPRLDGMFAFAILDRVEQRLTLARDPAGIKPLFFHVTLPDAIVFASEIKAIRELRTVGSRVNPTRLRDYLVERFTGRGDATLLEDVQQVPPGHYLTVSLRQPGVPALTRYWEYGTEESRPVSFASAVDELRDLLTDSVRSHLRSDVPLGFLLSGGLDSSSVLTIARQVLGADADLRTYSYIDDDPMLNESIYQVCVTAANRATRHAVRVEPEELVRDWDQFMDIQQEPFFSPVVYVQYRVLERAREDGVKVILGGQGADELFAGYQRFATARAASLWRQGRWMDAGRLIGSAAQRWQTPRLSLMRTSLALALPPLVADAYRAVRHAGRATSVPDWLNTGWFTGQGVPPVRQWSPAGDDVLREFLEYTLTSTHLQDLMRFEDRSGMALSMESRVPFLAPRLLRFASALPEEFLVSESGKSKFILREAMRGLVPDAILDRRVKVGFSVPVVRWLVQSSSWVEGKLAMAEDCPAVFAPALRRRWQQVQQGDVVGAYELWGIFSLLTWAERGAMQWQ
ncbi:MAG TPA: asparagine synthase (glutamine-hydrolyzing) [Gemmatimonadales bacterium]